MSEVPKGESVESQLFFCTEQQPNTPIFAVPGRLFRSQTPARFHSIAHVFSAMLRAYSNEWAKQCSALPSAFNSINTLPFTLTAHTHYYQGCSILGLNPQAPTRDVSITSSRPVLSCPVHYSCVPLSFLPSRRQPSLLFLPTLKAAVIKSLAWKDAFAILGRSDMALLRKHYYGSGGGGSLREQLRPESRRFWDQRVGNDGFSFMYSGTSGMVAWVLVNLVLPSLGLGFIRRLLRAGASKVCLGDRPWFPCATAAAAAAAAAASVGDAGVVDQVRKDYKRYPNEVSRASCMQKVLPLAPLPSFLFVKVFRYRLFVATDCIHTAAHLPTPDMNRARSTTPPASNRRRRSLRRS